MPTLFSEDSQLEEAAVRMRLQARQSVATSYCREHRLQVRHLPDLDDYPTLGLTAVYVCCTRAEGVHVHVLCQILILQSKQTLRS